MNRAMNKCEQIQPNLLDYSKGQLKEVESREVKTHLHQCADCRALLQEEVALAAKLESAAQVTPSRDAWLAIETRTQPKIAGFLTWLQSLTATSYRKAVTAAIAAALLLVVAYSFTMGPEPTQPDSAIVKHKQPESTTVTVKWSDDPSGQYTDAMVEFVDSM